MTDRTERGAPAEAGGPPGVGGDHEFRVRQEFAARLKLARMAAGFHDASEFARKIGADPDAYAGFEEGRGDPNLVELHAIAKTTEVALDTLVLGRPRIEPADTHVALAQIDFATIRALREWVAHQRDAPERLRELENEAAELRRKMYELTGGGANRLVPDI